MKNLVYPLHSCASREDVAITHKLRGMGQPKLLWTTKEESVDLRTVVKARGDFRLLSYNPFCALTLFVG